MVTGKEYKSMHFIKEWTIQIWPVRIKRKNLTFWNGWVINRCRQDCYKLKFRIKTTESFIIKINNCLRWKAFILWGMKTIIDNTGLYLKGVSGCSCSVYWSLLQQHKVPSFIQPKCDELLIWSYNESPPSVGSGFLVNLTSPLQPKWLMHLPLDPLCSFQWTMLLLSSVGGTEQFFKKSHLAWAEKHSGQAEFEVILI